MDRSISLKVCRWINYDVIATFPANLIFMCCVKLQWNNACIRFFTNLVHSKSWYQSIWMNWKFDWNSISDINSHFRYKFNYFRLKYQQRKNMNLVGSPFEIHVFYWEFNWKWIKLSMTFVHKYTVYCMCTNWFLLLEQKFDQIFSKKNGLKWNYRVM